MGTTKKQVTLIPDYLLCPNSIPYWILDAKSPKEDILDNIHIEQAYSYAIHPEIHAKYFALCNGKNFVLFSTRKVKPLLKFEMKNINENLSHLLRLLHPEILAKEELIEFNLDLGIYYLKMGFTPKTLMINFIIPDLIAKLNNTKFTLSANIGFEDLAFCISYDFDKKQYEQLLSLLPKELSIEIRLALTQQPFYINLDKHIQLHRVPEIVAAARLSKTIISKPEEDFLPLKVEYFQSFSHQ